MGKNQCLTFLHSFGPCTYPLKQSLYNWFIRFKSSKNKPCLVIFEPLYLPYFQNWLLHTFHGNILISLKDYTRFCHIMAYLVLCAFSSNIQRIFLLLLFFVLLYNWIVIYFSEYLKKCFYSLHI